MDVMGISADERNNIFSILAAILHLGNVEFAPHDAGSVVRNADGRRLFLW